MSFDLMVFDPGAAPSGRSEFMAWYDAQSEWSEDHSYADPSVCNTGIRAWFLGMISEFPAMNGPYASGDIENELVTDYCIGRSVIYAAFSWSIMEAASATALRLASEHRVGFYDVSAEEGSVWLPLDNGGYEIVHRE